MKNYTMYVCETCGYESLDAKEIMQHEADHLCLTVKEMEQYRALKSFAIIWVLLYHIQKMKQQINHSMMQFRIY